MIEELARLIVGREIKVVKTTEDTKDGPQHTYTVDTPVGGGPVYSDTDSVAAESLIDINGDDVSISSAFIVAAARHGIQYRDDKELVWLNGTYESHSKPIKAIYRHRTKKRKFKVTLESGKSVIVTEDHSIMVMRDGKLTAVKPEEINVDTDLGVSNDVQRRDGEK